jgi:hypothetical protein
MHHVHTVGIRYERFWHCCGSGSETGRILIISTDPDPNPDLHLKTADQDPRTGPACWTQESAYCKFKVVQFFVGNIGT